MLKNMGARLHAWSWMAQRQRLLLAPPFLRPCRTYMRSLWLMGMRRFDSDAALILRDMAYGKPMSAEQTLSLLGTVSAEAGECYARTGDFKVHEALRGVTEALNAMDGNERPVTLTIEPKTKGRVV